MKKTRAILAILAILTIIPVLLIAGSGGPGITPDQALEKLEQGNARYVSDNCIHPRADGDRRNHTASNGQHPFATVIACSDSRVPVERLFDQGVGDVFVIRVAGNVCDNDEIGSIEYGVDHLRTPICVVLGHSGCGAVTAVCTDAEVHGSIPELIDNIEPAVEKARKKYSGFEGRHLVPYAVRYNVLQSIDDLFKGSPAVRELVDQGKLKVVGAVYDLASGNVKWMGSHPEEKELITYYDDTPSHDKHEH